MKFERFFYLFVIPVLVFLLWSLDADAEEIIDDSGYPYYFQWSDEYMYNHAKIRYDHFCGITCDSEVIAYLGNSTTYLGCPAKSLTFLSNSPFTLFCYRDFYQDDVLENHDTGYTALRYYIDVDSYSSYGSEHTIFNKIYNFKIFETEQDARRYLETGDTSGWINEDDFILTYTELQDAIDNAQCNSEISFIDFSADNSVFASWAGLDGVTDFHIDYETGHFTEEPGTYENAFIKVEFGYADKNNAGVLASSQINRQIYMVKDGSFSIPMSSILEGKSENYYLLYLKATPYVYNNDDVTARLYEGNSEFVYFDPDQNVSWRDVVKAGLSGSAGSRRGTVFLNDFYLSDVICKRNFEGTYTISWSGSTKDSDLLFIPREDTLVMSFYTLFDKQGNLVNLEPGNSNNRFVSWLYGLGAGSFWGSGLEATMNAFNILETVRISDNSVTVQVKQLLNLVDNSEYAWDGTIGVSPAYYDHGMLYIGQTTYVNLATGSVVNEGVNEDGSLKYEDVTQHGSGGTGGFSASDLLNNTNIFYSYLSGVVSGMGQLPAMFAAVFSFLPAIYINSIGILLVLILLLRLLGR